ncbi:MAG: hypothetical protein LBR70_05185 [Lactobacillaceae bacterium]|jgi:hypothetical protein|nr:hypothetical protein [Lactobacillaceae bacterium]
MGGRSSPKSIDVEARAKKEAEAERKKTIERHRRGIAGTIKTSYRGILDFDKEEPLLRRKNLLGE